MLLTKQLDESGAGGRELLCSLNHQVLKEIFGDQLILFEVPRPVRQSPFSFLNACRGHIDGLDRHSILRALETIRANNVSRVFVDGSNLGGFVHLARIHFPQLEITTFFHNVESKFFLDALKHSRTPRALGVLAVNYLAERKAVRYSDKRICMSGRDSACLQRVYGRAATHISPIAMLDKCPRGPDAGANAPQQGYALFVGGNFYANRAGINWFVERVAPRVSVQTCIVGRGLDDLKPRFETHDKVKVVGAVDSLADWYRNARFVIAPIFDGSGMKTKVAEALMFGKKVIGTPEAFSGYEAIAAQAGWICRTEDDFVAAIAQAQDTIVTSFDVELRTIYEQAYSYTAAVSRLRGVLGE